MATDVLANAANGAERARGRAVVGLEGDTTFTRDGRGGKARTEVTGRAGEAYTASRLELILSGIARLALLLCRKALVRTWLTRLLVHPAGTPISSIAIHTRASTAAITAWTAARLRSVLGTFEAWGA